MSAVGPQATPDDIDAETREDALDVLGDLLHWQLPPSRWEQITVIVGQLETAWSARDVTAVRAAVAELELSGPVRATRIGTEPTSAPRETQDRVNTMVVTVGGRSEPTPERAPDGGTTR